uniref:Protein transport protein Sec31A n=1 Tax=Sinocyclocheilus grahami TaxID=75366 RepID=A0A672MYW8_SINGR
MKLKEVNRTAMQAWSPAQQHPICLAAGTSAQQLDATFSTSASLEIFELDLADPTLAMKSCGSFSSPHRYHKLVWGPHGIEDQSLPSGVLIAGGENGNIILYDASKIIAGDSEVIISQSEKHTGPVRALDVNSSQTNLVASGGNESEIYIWDLNNLSSPMTPGPKTQPLEDISCVAWNKQVQHILASASPSGKASVWDLRKNDLIIKVSDHSNRVCAVIHFCLDFIKRLLIIIGNRGSDTGGGTLPLLEPPVAWLKLTRKRKQMLMFVISIYIFLIKVEKKSTVEEEEEEPPAAETSDLDEIPSEDEEPAAEETSNTDITPAPTSDTVNLKVSQDVDGLITQALLTGDYEAAVNLCLHDNRMADGIILAIAGGPELLAKTQKKYFSKTQSKISKLISAVVMKDWLDILETCDLQNWKEALAAVMTYAKPEEFSSLCGLLGSRLEAAEDTALQAQACLCYICAGTVEQLVAYWAKAQDSCSPLALQELVEKVVVLQRAVLRAQGGVSPDMGALLAEKMNQYASLLASQGSLQTAISYLPTNTQQVAVHQLRDRLSRALGQQQQSGVRQTLPAAVPVQTYTQPQPPQVPAQPAAHTQYYPQGRSASTVTSWSNQTPTALPSVPRPLVPGADPQVESSAPVFGLQSPVSASAPFMFSQQYQNYPPAQQFMPAAGTPGIYQPLQYSSSTASPLPPPPSSSSSSAPAVYPPQFMHPASSQPAAPPVISGPPQGQPFSPPPPLSSGVSFQHGGPGSPTAYLPPPVARAPGIQTEPALIPAFQRAGGLNQDSAWSLEGPQNGWNDPPALNRAPKKKKMPENFTPPAPITAPIMAPLGDPQVPAAAQTMQTLQPQQQRPDQPVGPATFSPIQQQPLGPPGRNPSMPRGNMEGAPGAPIGDVIKVFTIPTEKITKKPIPEEHMVLKTTFEGLIQKCLAAASDPQTKRKLDDAHKRLEYLYDKLREQTLSPAIVGGLHNMARSIECRCYTDGLNIHTHIVSSSNFSETSAFMPILKVVLTQANKLGV